MGASNTTEVRFYIDRIGGESATWVCVSKLPNGKRGAKVMSTQYDSEIGENYAYLSLSSFYTQAKGDLYLTLCGYDGGITYEQDEQDLYTILGTPTIQATGSVKLNIQYATQIDNGDENETITLQQLLALLGEKLNKNSPNYIKVVDSIANINSATYVDYLQNDDLVFSKFDRSIYRLSMQNDLFVATFIQDINSVGGFSLTSLSGSLTTNQVILANKDIAFALYNGQLYTKISTSGSTLTFAQEWQIFDDTTHLTIGRYKFDVNGSTGVISNVGVEQYDVYSKDQADSVFVNLVGEQTISGKKTFIVLPESSVNPSTDNQFARKGYVDTVGASVQNGLNAHINDHSNPHQVTKTQIGLGNVDNVKQYPYTSGQNLENTKADKDNVYTKTQADTKFQEKLVAGAGITISGNVISSTGAIQFLFVQELPQTGQSGAIYFVPTQDSGADNYYDEYVWVESTSSFEKIGSTNVDLTGYATESWVQEQGYITISALSGYATEQWVEGKGYITGINSTDVENALGYKPEQETNLLYKPTTTYSLNMVTYYNGHLFVSLQNNNLGNTPSTSGDTTYWARVFVDEMASVSQTLTNCTSDNMANETIVGQPYSATITADSGYTLVGGSVSIIMNGNDITATAYSNGVISIPSVTGALEITINAVEIVDTVLANNSWENIANVCKEGKANIYWAVGDTKSDVGTDGYTRYYRIADMSGLYGKHVVFEQYTLDGSDGSATINGFVWNVRSNTDGDGAYNDYNISNMRTTHLPAVLLRYSGELQAQLENTSYQVATNGNNGILLTLTDKLFLAAAKEYGIPDYARTEENAALTTYQWYQTHNTQADRVKYKNGNLTSASGYWTRSPHFGDKVCVVHLFSNGNQNYTETVATNCVAPVFAW